MSNLETGPSPEEMGLDQKKMEGEFKTVLVSKEEAAFLGNGDVNDPELHKLMAEKGIEFDSGDIILDIEGNKKVMMTTIKDDFGTRYMESAIREKYGDEALKSLE